MIPYWQIEHTIPWEVIASILTLSAVTVAFICVSLCAVAGIVLGKHGKVKYCIWKHEDKKEKNRFYGEFIYKRSCNGQLFHGYRPSNYVYCPYCGGIIKEQEK